MKTIVDNGKTYELRQYEYKEFTDLTGQVVGLAKCPYCNRNVSIHIKTKKMCTTYCFCRAKYSPHPPYVEGKIRYARNSKPIS